jgi:hypothetical protein
VEEGVADRWGGSPHPAATAVRIAAAQAAAGAPTEAPLARQTVLRVLPISVLREEAGRRRLKPILRAPPSTLPDLLRGGDWAHSSASRDGGDACSSPSITRCSPIIRSGSTSADVESRQLFEPSHVGLADGRAERAGAVDPPERECCTRRWRQILRERPRDGGLSGPVLRGCSCAGRACCAERKGGPKTNTAVACLKDRLKSRPVAPMRM